MDNWRFQHGNLQELILLTNLLILLKWLLQELQILAPPFGVIFLNHCLALVKTTVITIYIRLILKCIAYDICIS